MRSRITLRSLLGVIVLGSLGGVAVMVWLTLAPGPDKKAAPQKPEVAADLKLDRVHYTETREGVKEWELEAASAVYFKEENAVTLDKVRATFYGKEQETYILVGAKGRYNTQTKVIEVFDGVKIDSSDGYHLRTQSLKYRVGAEGTQHLRPGGDGGARFAGEGGGDDRRIESTTRKNFGRSDQYLRSAGA